MILESIVNKNDYSECILAGCHSLIFINDQVEGGMLKNKKRSNGKSRVGGNEISNDKK
jgi:hypothetical protein